MKRMFWVFGMLMLLSSNFMPVLTYADGDDPEDPETPAVNNQQWQGDNQDSTDSWDSGNSWDSWDNSWDTNDVDSWDTDNWDSWDTSVNWDNSWSNWGSHQITINDPCLELSSTNLLRYTCEDWGNVVIPEWVTWIGRWAFNGHVIKSFQKPASTITDSSYWIFEWAILDWEMTFENWDVARTSFEGAIIWEHWKVSLWNDYNLTAVEVREGGELTINWWAITRNCSRMNIDWTLTLNWEGSLWNALQYLTLWENWNVIIWDGITTITDNSFYQSHISWNIVLPNSLVTMWNNAFAYATIDTGLVFPDTLEYIANSVFQLSTINWNLMFRASTTTIKWFYQAKLGWNMIFSWTSAAFESFYGASLSWSFICDNCWDLSFHSSNIVAIDWDFRVSSKWNINISQWGLSIYNVWGDFLLSWNEIPLKSVLQGLRVWGDFVMRGDKISLMYGALNGANISWDFYMSWDTINLDTDVVNALTIAWNLEIEASELRAQNWVLNSLKLWGKLKLPENSVFWDWVLWWVITAGSTAMWYSTTVSVGENTPKTIIDDISIVANVVESSEVVETSGVTTVQNAEIQATSGKVIEYQWWIEVYFENIGNGWTLERIEWTAKFSAPIAIKIPVANSNQEYVKVKVKHAWEDFWFTGLTLNPENQCIDWVAQNDQYNWEDVKVELDDNWDRFATIYTCSASTFVSYLESDPVVNTPSSSTPAWGSSGPSSSSSVKQEPVHNSADLVEEKNETSTVEKTEEPKVETTKATKKKATRVEEQTLTRWEVAIMTNILLEVYPQLIEGREEVNWIGAACHSYTDEKDFTDNEKRAITKLCRLSIMGIHKENNVPLEEFMVSRNIYNDEFATIVNRIVDQYTEKDFNEIKEVLSKLEGDESDLEFGTLYSVFMSIKKLFD